MTHLNWRQGDRCVRRGSQGLASLSQELAGTLCKANEGARPPAHHRAHSRTLGRGSCAYALRVPCDLIPKMRCVSVGFLLLSFFLSLSLGEDAERAPAVHFLGGAAKNGADDNLLEQLRQRGGGFYGFRIGRPCAECERGAIATRSYEGA